MNEPSTIRNNADVDFKDKNLDNVRFIEVNSMSAVPEHLTPRNYVDNAISNSVDEPSAAGNNQDNDFNFCKFFHLKSINLNTQAVNDISSHNEIKY